MHPQRHCLHERAWFAVARDHGATLGPHPTRAGAERLDAKVLGETRKRSRDDPRPAHHPDRGFGDPGILDVEIGDVLEPPGDRIEADTT